MINKNDTWQPIFGDLSPVPDNPQVLLHLFENKQISNIFKNRREHFLLQLSYVSNESYPKYRIPINK